MPVTNPATSAVSVSSESIGRGRIRTFEGISHQIYSPNPKQTQSNATLEDTAAPEITSSAIASAKAFDNLGIGGHHKTRGRTNEWLTPPGLLRRLGKFDLDPCSPVQHPWDTASHHYTIDDDGLAYTWRGRVWLNPPYGPEMYRWLRAMAQHGNGIALTFARTETDAFHRYVWPVASAILFIRGRINFCRGNGEPSGKNAGGPSVLIAYGSDNATALACSAIDGKFIPLEGNA